ncbi:MAG: hypothetical protein JNM17_35715 [Archangium sp.]|nr:hypothetical protein [Archangium sp.]
MHAFDANGSVVIVFDAYGITTIDLDTDKVRMEKATSGTWFTAAGGTGLFHNERSNSRVARTIPQLEQARVSKGYDLKYQRPAMLSDGKRALRGEKEELKLYDVISGKESKPDFGTPKKLKPFSLGPKLDPYINEYESETFVGSDDSFAVLTGDGTLRGGRVGKKGVIEKPWTVKCGFSQGVLRARPHQSGTFISAWHPALNKAFCALITADGVSTREVDSVSPVVFSGTHVVYQPSSANVMREPFRHPTPSPQGALDGSNGEAFAIPGEAHGSGELMSEGETVLFVTPDRESVLELNGQHRSFDRRLGDTTRADRPAFRDLLARFNSLARVANQVVFLKCIHMPQYGRGVRPHYDFGHGDFGFLRLAVSSWVVSTLRTERNGAWSLGSYSNPQYLRPIDAKELERDFAAIDAVENFDFLSSLSFLETPLHECWGGSFSDEKKVKPKPAMVKDAEHLLLCAVIEQLGSKKRVELSKNVAKWKKQKLTPASFIKALDPLSENEAWNESQTAVAWLVLDYFQEDVVDVFIDWFALRPSGMVQNNSHIVGDAAKRMMKQWPATKKPFLAALEKAAKSAKEDVKGYLDNFRQNL